MKFSLYYCRATATRRKARYLGIYANKSVRAIGRIGNVVACDVDLKTSRITVQEKTRELQKDEQQRILGASLNAKTHGWDLSHGIRFYLCDEMVETDFRKTSPGSMQSHRYFDLEREILHDKVPDNLTDLAKLLRDRPWPAAIPTAL